MRLIAAFLAVFYLLNGTGCWGSGTSSTETKWMKQKRNNFNNLDKLRWKMRYMVNEKYLEKGGPMFIYVGGEIPISAPFVEWGLLTDMAAEHRGILFYPEHRFYGKSKVGKSLSMCNLKFLNALQALADLANFIKTQRETDPRLANSKVILAGCSYAGSLAVWFNRLYPDLVDGTWAISAPILAKAEFPEYLEITGKAIKELGSQECYDRIQRGIEELQKMFSDDRAEDAKKMLKLCDHFDHTNEKDIWTLFRAIQHLFATLVVNQKLHKGDVPSDCDFIKRSSADDLSAVASYFIEYYRSPGKCKSLNYLGTVFYHNKTSYDNIISRQWMYQTCNEFGWFQDTASNQQPFGNNSSPITLDWNLCNEIFGARFTESRIRKRIAKTNKLFGGLNPNVTNIYMTYGSLDPWSSLGPGESEISTVVPQYSHCAHVDSINMLTDTPEMIASKQRLLAKVREWLA